MIGKIFSLLAAGTYLATPSFALAQSDSQPSGLEEIVVTARRTSENLQTTPVATTALTQASLERSQISSVLQLQASAPNLVIATAPGDGNTANLAIRGQVQRDNVITLDPSVAIYQDGVFVARSTGALLNLIDVQRVEVLRGPQGTLFGRNTTGGALSIISNAPTSNFEGSIKLQAGNYGLHQATVVANIPIVQDVVAARLVGHLSRHDGYGKNVLLDREIADENLNFVRGSIAVTPSDSWSLLIQGDYTRRKNKGGPVVKPIAANNAAGGQNVVNYCADPASVNYAFCAVHRPGDLLTNYVGGDYYTIESELPAFAVTNAGGVNATLIVDLSENVKFKSISAWRAANNDHLIDLDGLPYGLIVSAQTARQNQWSQELQLYGEAFDKRLNWIIGAYYFTEKGHDFSENRNFYPRSPNLNHFGIWAKNDSWAVFGQGNYSLTDELRVTAGLRYTKDTRWRRGTNYVVNAITSGLALDYHVPTERLIPATCTLDLNNPAVLGKITPATIATGRCEVEGSASFSAVSYTLGIDYRLTPNAFVYLKTSHAAKSGGFPHILNIAASLSALRPEKVTDYEAGLKLEAFDRRLRLNAAAFYSKSKDLQRSVQFLNSAGINTNVLSNAASGHVYGAEFEVTAVIQNLTLQGSLGLLKSVYDSFIDPATGNDLSGLAYVRTPTKTWGLQADYVIPFEAGELTLHGDYTHTGAQFYATTLRSRAGSYGIAGASATLSLENHPVDITVWGRNLTNTKYETGLLESFNGLGYVAAYAGDPRTYGVSVTYRF